MLFFGTTNCQGSFWSRIANEVVPFFRAQTASGPLSYRGLNGRAFSFERHFSESSCLMEKRARPIFLSRDYLETFLPKSKRARHFPQGPASLGVSMGQGTSRLGASWCRCTDRLDTSGPKSRQAWRFLQVHKLSSRFGFKEKSGKTHPSKSKPLEIRSVDEQASKALPSRYRLLRLLGVHGQAGKVHKPSRHLWIKG